ncbi:hypothetical protein [Desulfovibrio gilichinskyi]|uniref:hypothetical protein n=1 Tax=Desulfovibrio gilichinskyi TaxID=1519643 RepID=UPI0010F462A7|nr:hypothetical protein [Desulfovibrio gilichinskyi]
MIKRTGRALWEIGSLAGRSGLKLAGDAGYEAFKKISPLAHPETKNEAAKYAKKVILGETSLGQELVKSGPKIAKSTKEAWNSMVEKEKDAEKHQNEINHKVYSGKWSDLYSKNSTLRKQRAKAIQDAVSPSLKGIAKAYLDTPDDRVTPLTKYLDKLDQVRRKDRK